MLSLRTFQRLGVIRSAQFESPGYGAGDTNEGTPAQLSMELLVVDTELLVVDTERLVVDTERLVVDTERLVVDTELLVVDTELLVVDTKFADGVFGVAA